MKTFLFSLAAVLLIAGQLAAPVVAAPLAADPCGSDYTIQNKDTLKKIADLCGTTVSNIMELNPQIANPNLIYPGQEIRIRGKAPIVARVIYTRTLPTTHVVMAGETFLDIATQYGTTIWEILQANPGITFFTKLVPGMALKIPATKKTTSFTTISSVIYYPYAKVSVSQTQAERGADIYAYVSGFPPGASIDFKVGVSGQTATYVFDGTIDENGNEFLNFEIPTTAKVGELWVVFVTTTSQKEGVTATSPLIVIVEEE